MLRALTPLAFLMTFASAMAAGSGVSSWSRNFALPGFDSSVNAVAMYQGRLIATGSFSRQGTEPVAKIAAWDGNEWTTLGGGISSPYQSGWVLFPWNGDLIVGGRFAIGTPGGVARGVVRWDGTQFRRMSTGLDGAVLSIVDWGGTLVAGGSFWYAGDGRVLKHLAWWDGVQWQPWPVLLGNGVFPGSLFVHQGQLYAMQRAYPNTKIIRWNGTDWEVIGAASPGAIPRISVKFASFGTDLLVAGPFTSIDGVPISNFARWDGVSWQEVGGGVNGMVTQLVDLGDGSYLLAGEFDHAGSMPARGVAIWDGQDWTPLDGGVGNRTYCATRDGDDLVLGGIFSEAGYDYDAHGLARWTDKSWSAISRTGQGVEGRINALLSRGSDLIAGGLFAHAGGTTVGNIARYDGAQWLPCGSGLGGEVLALAAYKDLVFGGGSFTVAGQPDTRYVASWNGKHWSAADKGLDGPARAFATRNGELFVGGSFSGGIARWTGDSWTPLDAGTDGPVLALHSREDELVVGGSFALAGGTPAANLAGWNEGWTEVGGGTDGTVRALATYRDELVVGGDFDTAGSESSARLARWSGTGWSGFGEGLTPSWSEGGYGYSASVRAVEPVGDDLFVGGYLIGTSSHPTLGISRWNESDEWSDVGGGASSTVEALEFHGGQLWVGGRIMSVGSAIPSRGIAAWSQPSFGVDAPEYADVAVTGGLLLAQPNPFRGTTTVSFSLDEAQDARLTIHDVAGRLVTELVHARLPRGAHSRTWIGTDRNGLRVPSGVYFVRLQREDGVVARSVVRIR